jgi:hypothetical protein
MISSMGICIKKQDVNKIWIKLGVLHVKLSCLFYSNVHMSMSFLS